MTGVQTCLFRSGGLRPSEHGPAEIAAGRVAEKPRQRRDEPGQDALRLRIAEPDVKLHAVHDLDADRIHAVHEIGDDNPFLTGGDDRLYST